MNQDHKHIILKCKDLAVGYRLKQRYNMVIDAINVDAIEGTFICILGKNGIGKSTLLRTLSKIQSKLSGSIRIDNTPIEELSASQLAQKMSLVLTERIPESNLTVYELIALGRQPYTNWLGTLTDEDHHHIQQAILHTHIKELESKRCDELSDGQLQKVMIARALAQNTSIILLDEPTAHLDIHHKIAIFHLLRKLVSKFNKTIIISTHEIHLALQSADDLWLLNKNKLVSGATKDLINTTHLANLFDSSLIKFDAKAKQFVINT